MDSLIYTTMTGAGNALRALEVRANNLANAQTAGFRADLARAQTRPVEGYGYDSRHAADLPETVVDHTPGRLSDTGRALDVAIEGTGYLAVVTDDGEAYLRAGSLMLDGDGALSLGGRAVLGEGGPLVLPEHEHLTIGADGTISVKTADSPDVQDVGRLKLVNPDPADLRKDVNGLLISRSGASYPADDQVTVKGGHLEGSNVSAIDEMMQTMSLTRSFEMQMRLFKVADEMADSGNRLVRA